MALNNAMGDTHESWIQETFGGRRTPGSGNQWRNTMDVRQNRYVETFAWAIDGKSTRGQSMIIRRSMLDKAVEQADGERPMIAIRFYDDDRLRIFEDWIMVRADDFLELEEAAAK